MIETSVQELSVKKHPSWACKPYMYAVVARLDSALMVAVYVELQ